MAAVSFPTSVTFAHNDRSRSKPAQLDQTLILLPIDIATGVFFAALAHDAAEQFQVFWLGHVVTLTLRKRFLHTVKRVMLAVFHLDPMLLMGAGGLQCDW